jgi:predicted ATP-grasp superfamily ATP-dependent carboligase
MDRSEALLREIGWEGPAMVEYRYDDATGKAALMEINGRFWGSLPLASAAGAHFALGTYLALGLGEPLPDAAYRPGLRCRYFVPETRRLARILFAPSRIADRTLIFGKARELLRYLGGFFGSHHYVFRLSDPLPFLADLVFMAREAARSAAAHLPSRGPRERAPPPLKQ